MIAPSVNVPEPEGGTPLGAAVPLFCLAYERATPGHPRSWIARSVHTGHVALAGSRKEAIDCLCRTIMGCIRLAEENGIGLAEWLQSQRPDEQAYVQEFFQLARERGHRLEVPSGLPNRIALATV